MSESLSKLTDYVGLGPGGALSKLDNFIALTPGLAASKIVFYVVLSSADIPPPPDVLTFGPIPLFPDLPESFPVKLSIVMDTIIGATKSLREVRIAQQALPLWDIEIPFQELRDKTQNQEPFEPFVYPTVYQQYEELVQNWLMMYGRTGVFGFNCPWDNSRADQQIAVGDAVTTTFTIVRSWGTGLTETLLPIGLIGEILEVRVNNAVVPPAHYTAVRNKIYFVDEMGIAYPPGLGDPITMTFTFYYLCRFTEDEQDFEEFSKNRWTVPSLKFRAVIWP